MKEFYSIIIPIHNEGNVIYELIKNLKTYSDHGHEVIIIDDGSEDNSESILKTYNFIKVITLKANQGKGKAIKKGLQKAVHKKVIIFDGDMEIHPKEINNLMILNNDKNIKCVLGNRFKKLKPFKSKWDFGNYFFTLLFNFLHQSDIKDSLCCAKAFYRHDINPENLKSSKFDIDIELASILIKKHKKPTSLLISYHRRSRNEGKKLQVSDGISILRRIINFF